MKKSIDYWEENIDNKEETPLSLMELQELIEQRLELKHEKGTVTYRHWKKDTNTLIEEYNERFGKTYILIK